MGSMKDAFGDTPFGDFVQRGMRAQGAAEKARDKALAQVAGNNASWMDEALKAIATIAQHERMTGEQIRHYVEQFCSKPSHANAWGALIRTAQLRKLIAPTGRWLKMQDKQSHARQTPEYYRVAG